MVFPPSNSNNQEPLPAPEKDFNDLSFERQEAAKKQAKKWFLILLISGLLLGGVFAFGIAQLIEHFGLATKPDHPLRIEQYQK